MPDIGLLQGAPPRRSRPTPAPAKVEAAIEPARQAAAFTARIGAPVETIAERFAALPEEAITVVSERVRRAPGFSPESAVPLAAVPPAEIADAPTANATVPAAAPVQAQQSAPAGSARVSSPPPVVRAPVRSVPPSLRFFA